MLDIFMISDLIVMQIAVYFLLSLNIIVAILIFSFKEAKKVRFLILGNTGFLLMHLSVLVNIQTSFASGIFVAVFNLLAITFYVATIYELNDAIIPIKRFVIYNLVNLIVILMLARLIDQFSILRAVTLLFTLVVIIDFIFDIKNKKNSFYSVDLNFIMFLIMFVTFTIVSIVINIYMSQFETEVESIIMFIVIFTLTTLLYVVWINFSIMFFAYHLINLKYLHLSYHDELTNLYNRRYILEQISHNKKLAERNHLLFSLISIDVDKFKIINDQYGHILGDQFLVEFSEILIDTFRSSDIIARFGGDEFLILAFTQDTSETIEIIRRLKNAIDKKKITKHKLPVQISVGMTHIDKENASLTLEELLNDVDINLYTSKNSKVKSQLYIKKT